MGDEREPLTEREREVYEAIRGAIFARGRPLSLDDVAEVADLYDRSAARKYVTALEKKRYVRQLEGHGGVELAEGSGLVLPVAGLIAAGVPIETCEAPASVFNFREAFGGEGNYMLQVRGDSMVEAGILDGDHLVVSPADTAEDGDKVVCRIDDAHTVKVYRVIRGVHWLYACNASVKPIRLDPRRDNRIVGLLVGVVRKER